MNKFSTRAKSIIAVLAVTAGLFVVAPAAAANAEPAGQYTWVCVGTDGNTYTMKSGSKLTSCHGSYLQEYIGGKFIKSYALKVHGTPVPANKVKLNDCAAAIIVGSTGVVVGLFIGPEGAFWAVIAGSLATQSACRA